MVRVFAHGAIGRWIDHSWSGPIELFQERDVSEALGNEGARRSSMVRAFAHGAIGRRIDHSW